MWPFRFPYPILIHNKMIFCVYIFSSIHIPKYVYQQFGYYNNLRYNSLVYTLPAPPSRIKQPCLNVSSQLAVCDLCEVIIIRLGM